MANCTNLHTVLFVCLRYVCEPARAGVCVCVRVRVCLRVLASVCVCVCVCV